MPKRLMMRPAEVASVLGVTPRTVRRLLASGELRGLKMGNRWMIPRTWLAQQLGKSADELWEL